MPSVCALACTAAGLPPLPPYLRKAQAVRAKLEEAEAAAFLGGGQVRIDTQHKKGKLGARAPDAAGRGQLPRV